MQTKGKHALLFITTSSSTYKYTHVVQLNMSCDYFLELGGGSHGLFSTISWTAQALALKTGLQEFALLLLSVATSTA